MSKQAAPVVHEPPARPPKPAPPRKFEAPDEDLTPYGVQTQLEHFIDGIVETDKVRALLDAFGLHERKEVAYPFQHMKKMHGEIWSMRIEPAVDHLVADRHVRGHHWTYKRDYPETTAGVQ